MSRALVVLGAAVAGVAVGALVFKMVGEERVGAEIRSFTTKLGFAPPKAGDDSTLQALDRVAPGTQAGFESAIIGTAAAALIAATATTIAVREIVG